VILVPLLEAGLGDGPEKVLRNLLWVQPGGALFLDLLGGPGGWVPLRCPSLEVPLELSK